MKIKTIALFALLGAAVPMSTASAVTIATPDTRASASTSSTVHKADYRDRTRYDRRRKFHNNRHRYTPGGRYERAPNHWHRHGSRPRDWRTRGCVMVGPIWWCP